MVVKTHTETLVPKAVVPLCSEWRGKDKKANEWTKIPFG